MFNDLLKNKKKLWLLIGGVIIIIALIVFLIMYLSNGSKTNNIINYDGRKIAKEYESLNNKDNEDGKKYPTVNIPSNNVLKYSSSEEILKIFENGSDAVVYFGYATCLYCRTAIQVLCDTAKNTELDAIYYLDVYEKDNKYDELLNMLGDELVENTDGKKNIISPLVIFIVDGKVASYNKGTLFSQDDPYIELDNSQIKGLSEIYRYGIKDVLESKKFKSSVNN